MRHLPQRLCVQHVTIEPETDLTYSKIFSIWKIRFNEVAAQSEEVRRHCFRQSCMIQSVTGRRAHSKGDGIEKSILEAGIPIRLQLMLDRFRHRMCGNKAT